MTLTLSSPEATSTMAYLASFYNCFRLSKHLISPTSAKICSLFSFQLFWFPTDCLYRKSLTVFLPSSPLVLLLFYDKFHNYSIYFLSSLALFAVSQLPILCSVIIIKVLVLLAPAALNLVSSHIWSFSPTSKFTIFWDKHITFNTMWTLTKFIFYKYILLLKNKYEPSCNALLNLYDFFSGLDWRLTRFQFSA